jgi:BirA family transcriptional regulator, biotin operon repressor / biotin---[acetyl-CoA-carboxylase] ligase
MHNSDLQNLTVVVAKQQTNGRGQLAQKWISEPHKNLTFSVFLKFKDLQITENKYLNFAISLAIHEVLLSKKIIKKTTIKWPNDLLSGNKKICGTLIENTFSGNHIKNSIIGIGLNVNQELFPEFKPNATSLKLETGLEFNLNTLLNEILIAFQNKLNLLKTKQFELLEEGYLKVLYKKNIPSMFKNSSGDIFMGIITGISNNGKLQIQLEDDAIKEFGIKEVSFL